MLLLKNSKALVVHLGVMKQLTDKQHTIDEYHPQINTIEI